MPRDRNETLDCLRGFALLGILLVNMALFSWPMQKVLMAAQDWSTPIDVMADWLVRIFAEGKFYPLFAFIFGIGVALQMERTEQRAGRFGFLYSRRLLVLFCIGLCHAFLVWEGDILLVYSILGFLLIPFRRCKPVTLLIWTVLFLQIPIAIYLSGWAVMTGGSWVPEIASQLEQHIAGASTAYESGAEENLRIFAHGTYAEIFVQRARNLGFLWMYIWVFGPVFLAMFLLGLFAAREHLLDQPDTHAKALRRMLVFGLAIGLPANVFYAIAFAKGEPLEVDWLWTAGSLALAVGGPALTFAYVAAFTLALRHERARRILQPIAAAGRMALSNYLLQSLICTTIFYSYGLGLYGSVGRAPGLALALVIYAAQVPLSVWWLRRFRFGPAEWLWRCLTYGRIQPMRI